MPLPLSTLHPAGGLRCEAGPPLDPEVGSSPPREVGPSPPPEVGPSEHPEVGSSPPPGVGPSAHPEAGLRPVRLAARPASKVS